MKRATLSTTVSFCVVVVVWLSCSGFLSIDCGLTANSNPFTYTDTSTRLTYQPDIGFVDGGVSFTISSEYRAGAIDEQEKTLRSFPDGLRNCYTLQSVTGQKFLLRATFTYGNYDGLNKSLNGSLFLFELYIGFNFWTTVNLTKWDPSQTIWKEVLTMATDNYVSVCLVNSGFGTPFVSALELRPLQDAMYTFVNTSVSVSYFKRIRFGMVDENITRYPVDPYDRFWEKWDQTSYPWLNLNTSKQVNKPGDDEFQVPSVILQKASSLYPIYSAPFINIKVKSGDNLNAGSLEFLPIFHFAEISNGSANRTFNICSAGELIFRDFSPSQLRVVSKYQKGRYVRNRGLSFNLTASTRKHPPLINAFELYSFVGMENFTTASDDVNYINEVKNNYSLAKNWNGDPCSPREYAWEGLTCDYSKGNKNPRIFQVNLTACGLRGGLANSFMNMSSLESLDLSHNNLKGPIPDYQLNSLRVLNLSNNQLEGPISDSVLRRFQAGLLELRLEGNPICSKDKGTYCSNKSTKRTLLISVLVPVASLLVVMCILWKLCWKGKSGDHENYDMYEEETPLYIDIRRFTYAELKLITNNFQSIIGKGGFGTVYHGILENGGEVAVKVLVETSISESTDFLPEVQTLSKVHHKNLVALEGYCQNKKCLALVYDFMPRGNLQQLLRGGHGYSLNWEERLRIALDAAQGLEYLHESCTPSIVHRDVKTSNILLDINLVGVISDFGLSRAFNDAHTHISTVAAGTLGYLDPEYHATFQLTTKTDVFSFGIVLLEIVTGQPPVFMDPQTVHLPNWVRQKVTQGSVHDVADKMLSDQYDADSLQCVIDTALNCLENAAVDRPTMTEVVSRLKVCLPAPVSASPRQSSAMDPVIPRQFQLMISGASPISNEENSFRPNYTGGMSETSLVSGR